MACLVDTWKSLLTNEEVIRRITREPQLLSVAKKSKVEYFGKIMRCMERKELLKLILPGKVNGKRRPRRRHISWLKNLRTWCKITSTELFHGALKTLNISVQIANIR